ncbi:HK97 gp10 family phage protein [Streptomyces canus]|uniref:HK97 gp10 family phage protein n=1 Tax=Streptomyces canus TaxID=58343 RepID=UPI00386EC4EA|nr:HK97 gp10 family phage protein [Streptomyces canus]
MPSPSNPHPNADPRAGAYSNAAEIAAVLEGRAARVLPQALSAVRHYTMLLETQIKANASGRPGPNVITGDYRRSWTHEVYVGGGVVTGVVGTNKPQARRLEYGFVGADSLGRVYDQPPYAHVGPAVQTIGPLLAQALGEIADGGMA